MITPYCNDEDLATRAPGDFVALAPKWQSLAGGSDGVLAAGSPWVLSSASAPFADQGVTPGCVVHLVCKPAIPGTGLLFAVEAVAAGSITLRQIGQAAGVGSPPPVPPSGLSGVTFSVPTFGPQSASVSADVREQYGIDANFADRAPARVYDPNGMLKQLAVLTVLQRQYADLCRGDKGDFVLKLRQVEGDLAAVKARVSVKFGERGEAEAPANRFSFQRRR